MTWTAPEVAEPELLYVNPERQALENWLDFHRTVLLHKCAGLTGEQLCLRSAEPSSMSLLGLVRHMAEVERSWFRRRLAGLDVGSMPFIYVVDGISDDGDFDDVDPAKAQDDFATLAEEIRLANEVAATKSLDDTFHHSRLGCDVDLRWVYIHMIEEYARHNGHADLLRERIDGVTED